MTMPLWVRDILRERGVRFEEVRHRPAFTAQQVAANEHISGHRLIKVVVVLADGQPIELALPASRRVHLDRVRELLGAKEVRLATEREMERTFPDCEVGALPPVPHGVPIIADPAVEFDGDIFMQAGTHEDAIRMNYRDWYNLARPRVAAFSEIIH